jgi:DNA-binding transcriptional LysR family regulator
MESIRIWNSYLMDLASLSAFVYVARDGSFSAAADDLHLTQPAVSKRVASLELSLGTRLFDRIGRSVSLTEAGHTLLPRAHRILAEVRDSRRALKDLSGVVAGSLLVGTSHHVGLHRLPPVLRSFTSQHPAVELELRFLDSELIVEQVLRGEIEFGIATLPPVAAPGLALLGIWEDQLVPVIKADHPLAVADSVGLAELARHRAILPGDNTYTRRIIDATLRPLGLELRVVLATNYLETIRMMVSVGLGWSILPRQMLGADLLTLGIAGFSMSRRLGVIYHRGRTLSNAARALMDALESEASVQTLSR